jgi:hypothetical protein
MRHTCFVAVPTSASLRLGFLDWEPHEGWVLDQGSGVGGYAPMTPD